MENSSLPAILNNALLRLFLDGLKQAKYHPKRALFFLRVLFHQRKQANKRLNHSQNNLSVPPMLIISATRECNLKCHGCYDHALKQAHGTLMSAKRLEQLLTEAQDLGVGVILIAGGEPLMRPDLLETIAHFPKMIFPFFTNGLLIDETIVQRLKTIPHLFPVLSLEGSEKATDERRGDGTYNTLVSIMSKLKKEKIFFGISQTLMRTNVDSILAHQAVSSLIAQGSGLFFFIDFIPAEPGTEDKILSVDQRALVMQRTNEFRRTLPALFIAFPGDEEDFGGCLAAGRGFVHVSAEGKVEPCPFSPYSDADLQSLSLKEALQSEFLKKLRDNPSHLSETDGGCALFAKKEWVKSVL